MPTTVIPVAGNRPWIVERLEQQDRRSTTGRSALGVIYALQAGRSRRLMSVYVYRL